jgi:hypothetical protein
MRVLVTIPHYFGPPASPGALTAAGKHRYGAYSPDPGPRIAALSACLTALHGLFPVGVCFIDHGRREARIVETSAATRIDVVICTTQGRHLLEQASALARYYTHCLTDAEPLLLGFACHDVLRARLGSYDYYCYLEDDLVLHDPWFFVKLAWFTQLAGDDKVLQPNRFEAGLNFPITKVYVDGALEATVTAPFHNIRDSEPLAGDVMSARVTFERTLNPHSGCFFLNAHQMEHWAGQPHWYDRASRLIGPLETTASLGILRTFKVYRAAPAHADFLEIQHFGTGYLAQLHPVEEQP